MPSLSYTFRTVCLSTSSMHRAPFPGLWVHRFPSCTKSNLIFFFFLRAVKLILVKFASSAAVLFYSTNSILLHLPWENNYTDTNLYGIPVVLISDFLLYILSFCYLFQTLFCVIFSTNFPYLKGSDLLQFQPLTLLSSPLHC